MIDKLISVAQGEIGYIEKASNSNLDDKTANQGTANYTKYGAWYGINPGAWCAMFVSWCFSQAGISDRFIKYAGCTTGMTSLKNKSMWKDRDYTPKKGDVVFYNWNQDTSTAQHTGIVESISGTTLTVIEGNKGNACARRTIKTTNKCIIGYGIPNYDEETTTTTETTTNETTTNSSTLNVGDSVKITGSYASSSTATSASHTKAKGWTRQILKIYEGRNYPYQVGNSSGTTGFFKAESLKKV